MIALTQMDEGNEYITIVDANSIESIREEFWAGKFNHTVLNTKSGREYCVRESREEVTRKVLEYRLAMVRYKSSFLVGVQDKEANPDWVIDCAESELEVLSGLSAEKGAEG